MVVVACVAGFIVAAGIGQRLILRHVYDVFFADRLHAFLLVGGPVGERQVLALKGRGSRAVPHVRSQLLAEERLIHQVLLAFAPAPAAIVLVVEPHQIAIVPALHHMLLLFLLFGDICDIGSTARLRVHRRLVDTYFTLVGMAARYARFRIDFFDDIVGTVVHSLLLQKDGRRKVLLVHLLAQKLISLLRRRRDHGLQSRARHIVHVLVRLILVVDLLLFA